MPQHLSRAGGSRLHLPRVAAVAITALLLSIAACDDPIAYGDMHAIIIASDVDLWDEVVDEVEDVISPTIQAVSHEHTFRITWQDPTVPAEWGRLRRFRNLVLIGAVGDPWIDDALATRGRGAPPVEAPTLIPVTNVWARQQRATILLLPTSNDPAALATLLPSLGEHLDREYREFVRARMFTTGVNRALADSLEAENGFRIEFPGVYRHESRVDSVFRFRNDNPSPAELIREIGVSWMSPIPEDLPDEGEIVEWREAFTAAYYNNAQLVDTTLTTYREVRFPGSTVTGVEFQAAWTSPPDDWPAGGAFITRIVPCPAADRLYFLDAWLYAPTREKYEYLIQLETLLDSFRCVGNERESSATDS